MKAGQIKLVLILMFTLVGCTEHIEYDEPNPDLHNKKISFNIPIAYIEPLEISGFNKDEYDNFLVKEGMFKDKVETKNLKNKEFTIKNSFWTRHNSQFVEDVHYVILKDTDNIKSLTYFNMLSHTSLREITSYYDQAFKN